MLAGGCDVQARARARGKSRGLGEAGATPNDPRRWYVNLEKLTVTVPHTSSRSAGQLNGKRRAPSPAIIAEAEIRSLTNSKIRGIESGWMDD